jgi:hypothetical protein
MTDFNQVSLQGFNASRYLQSELHQRIIGCLTICPMHRERLEQYTKMKGSTLRPRVCELMKAGELEVVGHTIVRGIRVELLGIRDYDYHVFKQTQTNVAPPNPGATNVGGVGGSVVVTH